MRLTVLNTQWRALSNIIKSIKTVFMKIFNQIKDAFTSADFNVESTMKVSDLCKNFINNFGLTLRVYKGKQIASDGRMTLNSLDQRTTTTSVNFDAGKLTIKANLKVGDVEKLFYEHFGIVVQIADLENKKLLSDELTLGDARRLQ